MVRSWLASGICQQQRECEVRTMEIDREYTAVRMAVSATELHAQLWVYHDDTFTGGISVPILVSDARKIVDYLEGE
jgi:hypothetical protein